MAAKAGCHGSADRAGFPLTKKERPHGVRSIAWVMRPPRFLQELRPTLHISHRGGSLLAPENTVFAFQQAAERYKTDMIELDIHITRDGVAAVAHDETLERCTDGAGRITELTWAEVQTVDAGHGFTVDGRSHPYRGQGLRIPGLSAVLQAFPAMRFNIELKSTRPGDEQVLRTTLLEANAIERVCVGSEDDEVAGRIAAAIPDVCMFYPRGALTAMVMALRTGAPWAGDEPYAVLDMPLHYGGVRLIDRDLLQRAEALGRWVNVWTIDEPREMAELIAEGVGGIMTDRPDLLRQVLDASR